MITHITAKENWQTTKRGFEISFQKTAGKWLSVKFEASFDAPASPTSPFPSMTRYSSRPLRHLATTQQSCVPRATTSLSSSCRCAKTHALRSMLQQSAADQDKQTDIELPGTRHGACMSVLRTEGTRSHDASVLTWGWVPLVANRTHLLLTHGLQLLSCTGHQLQ